MIDNLQVQTNYKLVPHEVVEAGGGTGDKLPLSTKCSQWRASLKASHNKSNS